MHRSIASDAPLSCNNKEVTVHKPTNRCHYNTAFLLATAETERNPAAWADSWCLCSHFFVVYSGSTARQRPAHIYKLRTSVCSDLAESPLLARTAPASTLGTGTLQCHAAYRDNAVQCYQPGSVYCVSGYNPMLAIRIGVLCVGVQSNVTYPGW